MGKKILIPKLFAARLMHFMPSYLDFFALKFSYLAYED